MDNELLKELQEFMLQGAQKMFDVISKSNQNKNQSLTEKIDEIQKNFEAHKIQSDANIAELKASISQLEEKIRLLEQERDQLLAELKEQKRINEELANENAILKKRNLKEAEKNQKKTDILLRNCDFLRKQFETLEAQIRSEDPIELFDPNQVRVAARQDQQVYSEKERFLGKLGFYQTDLAFQIVSLKKSIALPAREYSAEEIAAEQGASEKAEEKKAEEKKAEEKKAEGVEASKQKEAEGVNPPKEKEDKGANPPKEKEAKGAKPPVQRKGSKDKGSASKDKAKQVKAPTEMIQAKGKGVVAQQEKSKETLPADPAQSILRNPDIVKLRERVIVRALTEDEKKKKEEEEKEKDLSTNEQMIREGRQAELEHLKKKQQEKRDLEFAQAIEAGEKAALARRASEREQQQILDAVAKNKDVEEIKDDGEDVIMTHEVFDVDTFVRPPLKASHANRMKKITEQLIKQVEYDYNHGYIDTSRVNDHQAAEQLIKDYQELCKMAPSDKLFQRMKELKEFHNFILKGPRIGHDGGAEDNVTPDVSEDEDESVFASLGLTVFTDVWVRNPNEVSLALEESMAKYFDLTSSRVLQTILDRAQQSHNVAIANCYLGYMQGVLQYTNCWEGHVILTAQDNPFPPTFIATEPDQISDSEYWFYGVAYFNYPFERNPYFHYFPRIVFETQYPDMNYLAQIKSKFERYSRYAGNVNDICGMNKFVKENLKNVFGGIGLKDMPKFLDLMKDETDLPRDMLMQYLSQLYTQQKYTNKYYNLYLGDSLLKHYLNCVPSVKRMIDKYLRLLIDVLFWDVDMTFVNKRAKEPLGIFKGMLAAFCDKQGGQFKAVKRKAIRINMELEVLRDKYAFATLLIYPPHDGDLDAKCWIWDYGDKQLMKQFITKAFPYLDIHWMENDINYLSQIIHVAPKSQLKPSQVASHQALGDKLLVGNNLFSSFTTEYFNRRQVQFLHLFCMLWLQDEKYTDSNLEILKNRGASLIYMGSHLAASTVVSLFTGVGHLYTQRKFPWMNFDIPMKDKVVSSYCRPIHQDKKFRKEVLEISTNKRNTKPTFSVEDSSDSDEEMKDDHNPPPPKSKGKAGPSQKKRPLTEAQAVSMLTSDFGALGGSSNKFLQQVQRQTPSGVTARSAFEAGFLQANDEERILGYNSDVGGIEGGSSRDSFAGNYEDVFK